MEIRVGAVKPKGEERKNFGVRSVTIVAVEDRVEFVGVFVRKKVGRKEIPKICYKTRNGYVEEGGTPTRIPDKIFKAMARRAAAVMFEKR